MKQDDINRATEEEKQKLSMLLGRAAAARRAMEPLAIQLESRLTNMDFSKLK